MADTSLDALYDAMPRNVGRSRLDPCRDVILRWHREGHSYRQIAGALLAERGIRVHFETLRRYVLRRSRPRKGAPPSSWEPPAAAPVDCWAEARERMRQHKEGPSRTPEASPKIFEYTEEDASKPLYTETARPRKTQEELIAQRDAIRKAYEKPVIPTPEAPEKVFVFDPDKPPVNKYLDPHWCKENGKEQR